MRGRGVLDRLPLRTRLLALVLVVVALAVTLAGVASATALRGYLLDRVDGQLAETLREIAVQRRLPAGADPDGRPAPPFAYYTAQHDAEGRLVAAVSAAPTRPDLPVLDPATVAQVAGEPFTVPAEGPGDPWRVLVAPIVGGGSVLVAVPLTDVQDTVNRLLRIDALVAAAVLLAAALAALAAVRSSLRPLVVVEETAQAIAGGDLTRRVPQAHPGTEVGSLAASFNTMVDRFEEAYEAQRRSQEDARASEERMRRFIGDAGHELRTPLTAVRGYAELVRSGAVPDEAERARVVARIEAEAARMGVLVEDLLLLARLDQQRPLRREPVDVLRLATDAAHDARLLAPDHDVTVVPPEEPGEPPVVRGDEARLRQVLGNLVGNATVHTPAGTHVRVVVRSAAEAVEVDVADDGPGMAPDVASRVFERFYRADVSRSRASGGSGLGLAIVAALVAGHGGDVRVASAPGEGSTFTVRLPR